MLNLSHLQNRIRLFLLYLTTFTKVHRFKDSYTHRYCIAEVLIILFFKIETEIKILVFLVKRLQFLSGLLGNNILYTVVCTIFIGVHVQSFNTVYLLFPEIFLIL